MRVREPLRPGRCRSRLPRSRLDSCSRPLSAHARMARTQHRRPIERETSHSPPPTNAVPSLRRAPTREEEKRCTVCGACRPSLSPYSCCSKCLSTRRIPPRNTTHATSCPSELPPSVQPQALLLRAPVGQQCARPAMGSAHGREKPGRGAPRTGNGSASGGTPERGMTRETGAAHRGRGERRRALRTQTHTQRRATRAGRSAMRLGARRCASQCAGGGARALPKYTHAPTHAPLPSHPPSTAQAPSADNQL